MQLKSMSAAQYRSLRAIRMELDGVNVFIGANGVGKTNLYRGLQLVQAAVKGTLSREIAGEGGMMQVLWAGRRRQHEKARVVFSAEVLDEKTGMVFEYRVEAGIKPPLEAGFAFEPQIKEEVFSVNVGRGPVVMMTRKGPSILLRGDRGRMSPFSETTMVSETAISMLAQSAAAGEPASGHAGAAGRHDRDGGAAQPDLDRHPFGTAGGGGGRALRRSLATGGAAGGQDMDRGHAADGRAGWF